jgi:AraC family transcriptional regulator
MTQAAAEVLSTTQYPIPPKATTPRGRNVMEQWQARSIEAHVDAHLHETIRMADLARVAQLAPFRFKRTFRESFGCTPHQYVIRKRVERAQNLMLMSKESLSQIAAECGFVDQSHLSNLFNKIVRERPGTWRRVRTRQPQPQPQL